MKDHPHTAGYHRVKINSPSIVTYDSKFDVGADPVTDPITVTFPRVVSPPLPTMESAMIPDYEENPFKKKSPPYAMRGMVAAGGDTTDWHPPVQARRARVYQPSRMETLHMDDVEAAVASVYGRGCIDTTNELSERHQEELRAASEEAWDEGHTKGKISGRKQVVAKLDNDFGHNLNLLLKIVRDHLDNERATKDELRLLLNVCSEALAALLNAHHDDFAYEDDEHALRLHNALQEVKEWAE